MSAPLIWIVIPAVLAVVLYPLRRWRLAVYIAGLLIMLTLTAMAWLLPIGEAVSLGIPGLSAYKLADSMDIFGRSFVLGNSMRPMMALIYLSVVLWFGGAYMAKTSLLFAPLGIGIAALLTASLAIQPPVFSALLVELAALACVPILAPPGKATPRGVLRFLTFQTLGMCLILSADWLLNMIQASAEPETLIAPASLTLALGLALVGGIFPFHTWIPMLAENAHPYSAAFVFYMMPTAIFFLAMNYLNRYTQLGISTDIGSGLRAAGVIMVMVGGIWAAFERHLGRILGYAVVVQIGMGILSIGLGVEQVLPPTGAATPLAGIFFAQLVPQGMALTLWAQALSAIHERETDLGYRNMRGLFYQLPITTAALVLANFSLAGLPLLASFPGSMALWSALAQHSLPAALLSLAGNASLFAAGLRTLAVLVTSSETQNWQPAEHGTRPVLLVMGCCVLFMIGLSPHWFLPAMTRMALIFIGQSP